MYEMSLIRVLAVDDEEAIIDAYSDSLSDLLGEIPRIEGVKELEEKLFGAKKRLPSSFRFELHTAKQADEAIALVRSSIDNGYPYSVCLMDVRMPPGKDGVYAAEMIRKADPDVNIAIVTAYSDYDPGEISRRVPPADKLLYLQKPFHPWEIRQTAYALGAKWHAERLIREQNKLLEMRVAERTAELNESKLLLEEDIRKRIAAEERILTYQDRLRSLASKMADVQEEERRRIAESIHDNLGHLLTAIQLKAASVLGVVKDAPGSRDLNSILVLTDQALVAARNLTYDLSPPPLYSASLESALEWLTLLYKDRYGLNVELTCDEIGVAIDKQIGLAVYRGASELLLNVVKHSGTGSASVKMSRSGDLLEVTVNDAGKGFDPEFEIGGGAGFGLFNVRERVEYLGGEFSIESAAGLGATAVIRIPLH